jgi:hypothetical protein
VSVDASYSRGDQHSSWRRLLRLIGWGAALLVGPAVGLIAWKAFHMGPFEVAAVVFLLSFWLGPLLMARIRQTQR